MSGTGVAYAMLCIRVSYAMSGTDIAYDALPNGAIRHARCWRRGIVLRVCHAMPGTDIAHTAIHHANVRYSHRRYSYHPSRSLCSVRYCPRLCSYHLSDDRLEEAATNAVAKVPPPMVLRTRYAMSGTEIARAAIVVCASYAMSGTEIAYAVLVLCVRYAMCGMEIAYAARAERCADEEARKLQAQLEVGYAPTRMVLGLWY
eukprot:1190173-Rhodomonas_salina.3